MKKIILILICALSLFACNPIMYYKNQPIKKMILFPVMIGAIKQPQTPIMAAAIFNAKTNKIANQINKAQNKVVDKFRENAAITLRDYFKCNVVYGEIIQKDSSFTKLSKLYNFPLFTDNENFPLPAIASGDFNPFDFPDKYINDYNLIEYFETSSNYQETVKTICSELKVDAFAFIFSNLNSEFIRGLGNSSKIYLSVYLYIFDKNGNIITKGHNMRKSKEMFDLTRFEGEEIYDYQQVLENFPIEFEKLVSILVNKE